MTVHAEGEMDDDGLSVLDVERAALVGRIVARQRDTRTHELERLKTHRQALASKRSVPVLGFAS